ncbi:MAG: hypothetical protein HY040_20395 [Planctomycetes bacterium]|nr:hypothetical protein [Planctomycetota bacterium]
MNSTSATKADEAAAPRPGTREAERPQAVPEKPQAVRLESVDPWKRRGRKPDRAEIAKMDRILSPYLPDRWKDSEAKDEICKAFDKSGVRTPSSSGWKSESKKYIWRDTLLARPELVTKALYHRVKMVSKWRCS